MKEYFPTAKDIAELNEAAEQLTPKAIKSEPLSKLIKATTFYKTLSKSNCPDCVDMQGNCMKFITVKYPITNV